MSGKRINIQQIQQLAKVKGGLCLSDTFHNQNTKLLWQCKKGHQWYSKAGSVRNLGIWCPVCAGNLPLTIEQMQEIAIQKGGKCLSGEYINSKTKLIWQCKKGHRWEASPFSIKTRKSWCPVCAGNQPGKTKSNRIF